MEMMVRIVVSPERVPLVLDRLGEVVEQTRGEDGCTEYVVYTTDQPGELWLKEAYISQEYHDSVHEGKAEMKDFLAWIAAEMTQDATVVQLTRKLER